MNWKGLYLGVGLVLAAMVTHAGAGGKAVFVTTDFSTGSLSTMDLETLEVATNVLLIHSDATVRTHGEKIYVINRLGQDNILVVDPNSLGTPLLQFSTGNGTNPQDIAILSEEKAYVARLNAPSVLVVNPTTGDSLGSIGLSTFADADGFAETAALEVYDGKLYITCQRLDQESFFAPTDHSVIAVVDTATDQLVDLDAQTDGIQGIVLTAKNPVSQSLQGSTLVLSCVGSYGDATDGGIETVDLAQNASNGVVISETVFNGNVGPLAMLDATKGFVVVSDASFVNAIRPIDLGAKAAADALNGTSGGYIPFMDFAEGKLYVSDQGSFSDPASGGVRIFDATTQLLLAGPLSVGLPPGDFAFIGVAIPSDPVARADFGGDGKVDFNDFLSFAGAFGKQASDAGFDLRADFNDDGKVDFSDFLVFAGAFGKAVGG